MQELDVQHQKEISNNKDISVSNAKISKTVKCRSKEILVSLEQVCLPC
jgi:hypothetical protein